MPGLFVIWAPADYVDQGSSESVRGDRTSLPTAI